MHKSKGFTLIELVVVIAIIGILAGIAIPYYTEAQATARGARILADMRTIQAAYTMYLAKNGGEQNNLVVGSAKEHPEIIPLLVEQGYLEVVPTPPVGKAFFPNASNKDIRKDGLKIYKGTVMDPSLGGYIFYEHSAIDGAELIVAINLATPIPLTELVGN